MWKIKHIFDGEFGCEDETFDKGEPMISVTIIDENENEKIVDVPDKWLVANNLDVGSEWPDYSDLQIKTEHVTLRKARPSDLYDIYTNLWSDKESSKYMLWSVTESIDDAKDRLNRTMAFQENHKYIFFIIDNATGQVIGFAGMREIEPGIYEETGIALGPDFSGRGYCTEILNALVNEARAVGASQFNACNRTANAASRRVQEKCGFTFSHFENCIDPRDNTPYILEHNILML